VQRDIVNRDGKREVDFINCVAWRKTAAFLAKYFHKGEKIAIEGALHVRKYEKSDGTNGTAHEVMVDKAHFCTSRMSAAQTVPDEPAQDDPSMDAADESELPF
jgi:single-strand DNA-binding protein